MHKESSARQNRMADSLDCVRAIWSLRRNEQQNLQPKRENHQGIWQITRWIRELYLLSFNVFFLLGFSIRAIGWLRLRLCVYVCFWNWKEVSSNEPNVTLNMAIFKLTSMQTHYTSEKPLTLRHYGQMSFIWQRVCALFLCLFYTVSSREVTYIFHGIKPLYINRNCHSTEPVLFTHAPKFLSNISVGFTIQAISMENSYSMNDFKKKKKIFST